MLSLWGKIDLKRSATYILNSGKTLRGNEKNGCMYLALTNTSWGAIKIKQNQIDWQQGRMILKNDKKGKLCLWLYTLEIIK